MRKSIRKLCMSKFSCGMRSLDRIEQTETIWSKFSKKSCQQISTKKWDVLSSIDARYVEVTSQTFLNCQKSCTKNTMEFELFKWNLANHSVFYGYVVENLTVEKATKVVFSFTFCRRNENYSHILHMLVQHRT